MKNSKNKHKLTLAVIDIDGTIANHPIGLFPIKVKNKIQCRGCQFFKRGGCYRATWCDQADKSQIQNYFSENKVLRLTVNEEAFSIVHNLAKNPDTKIVYVSARGPSLLKVTKRWLRHHNFPSGQVFCVGSDADPTDDKVDCVDNLVRENKPTAILFLEDDPVIGAKYEKIFNAKNILRV